MPKTIYCTFDDSDIADIAMGSLRRSGLAINTIDNLGDLEHPLPRSGRSVAAQMSKLPFADGNILPAGLTQDLLPGPVPLWPQWNDEGTGTASALPGSHAATFKITCADKSCQEVVAKLVNFGAHRIRYY